jgi:putative phosphoesterase
MEIVVIADVHSNLPALEAVLDEIGDMEVFCCGDVIGYNPFPKETLEVFQAKKIRGVLGNHDHALINKDTSWLNASATLAVLWSLDVLTEQNLKFLASFPEKFRSEEFTAFHGSPNDPLFEYVYPDSSQQLLESFLGDSNILILGHTHLPFVKRLGEGIVFNPGSVGQPRDGNARASYAILDLEKRDVEIKRLSYDVDRVAEKIIENDLPKGLAERLYKGI